ncbi:ribonuclease H-like domain-containing protein [Tanacetum coccineum]
MAVNDNINKSGDDANKNHDDIGSSSELNLSFGDTLYLHPNDTSDMCNSVVVTGAIYAKTAFEMWSDLKEIYDKVDVYDVFNISLISLPPCTSEAAKHFEKHNQLIKLMQFLVGLDESYLAIRSNILTRDTLPMIFDNKMRPNNNSNLNKGSGSNSNSDNRGPNPNLKCTNCNNIGHTVDRCFELVGYLASYVKRNFNSSTRPVSSNNASADGHSNCAGSNNVTTNISHVSLSNEQLSRLMNLLNDNGVSSANANMAVNVVDISNLGLTVGHPNGTQALITKIGDLKINNDITLYDVLVVPEYTVSLLSVHKIARDSKLFVGFDDEKCYIQEGKQDCRDW